MCLPTPIWPRKGVIKNDSFDIIISKFHELITQKNINQILSNGILNKIFNSLLMSRYLENKIVINIIRTNILL